MQYFSKTLVEIGVRGFSSRLNTEMGCQFFNWLRLEAGRSRRNNRSGAGSVGNRARTLRWLREFCHGWVQRIF
ncbi:MAG: hypothetical protein ACFCBU_01090 [Cyanophyceae cyanobacterium]